MFLLDDLRVYLCTGVCPGAWPDDPASGTLSVPNVDSPSPVTVLIYG